MATSRLSRLLGTVLLLRSKEWVSAQQLADRFEVSLRTVYRDIEAIQQQGISVQGVPGPDGGYRLNDEGLLEPMLLKDPEARVLYLLGASQHRSTSGTTPEMTSALQNAHSDLRPEDAELLRTLSARIYFDTSDWYWKDDGTSLLPGLREAVMKQHLIEIEYTTRGSKEIEKNIVFPLGLVWKAGQWYLVGCIHEQKLVTRFRLDRISRFQRQEGMFAYPDDFDLSGWWHNEMERFGKGAIEIRLKASNSAREEILRLATKDNTKVETTIEYTLVTLYVDNWQWLIPLILSFGGSVIVEEPASLKSAVIEQMRHAIARFEEIDLDAPNVFVNNDSRLRATRGRHH